MSAFPVLHYIATLKLIFGVLGMSAFLPFADDHPFTVTAYKRDLAGR